MAGLPIKRYQHSNTQFSNTLHQRDTSNGGE